MTSAAAAIGPRQYRTREGANEGTPSGVPPSSRFGAVMSGASAPPPPAVDACGPKDDRGEADAEEHDCGARRGARRGRAEAGSASARAGRAGALGTRALRKHDVELCDVAGVLLGEP